MSTRSVTIREILSSTIRLSWREAIALVRGIADASAECASLARGGGTLDGFALDQAGRVFAISRNCEPMPLADLAGLLARLLPADALQSTEPVPAGVQFAIASAQTNAESADPASFARFSESLAAFEPADGSDVLRGLCDRCRVLHDQHIRRAARALGTSPVESKRRPERRSAGPGVDVLRRLLREADRELFLARQLQAQRERPVGRQNGPSDDVLRRFLRDADRTNYELRRAVEARRRHLIVWPRHRAAVGLAILLMAATAVAERQPLSKALRLVTRANRSLAARSDLAPTSASSRPVVGTTRDAATAAAPEAPRTARPRNAAVRAGLFPARSDENDLRDAAGTEGGDAGLVRLDDAAGIGQQTGRLVMAVDLADRPVFSPSFAANHSALFEEEAQSAAGGASASAEFVRVLSIANDRGRNYHPRLSPDGRMIAFDSDRDGVRGVYLASRDGRNVRRVSGGEYAAFAAWSPDGIHLAFVRSEPDQPTVWNVWSLNVQSGATARLTSYSTGQPWGVSWFPDGRRICYAHEHELVVLDALSGETRSYPSPRPDRMARMPVVSPDGNRVIFQVHGDGAWLLEMSDGSMREVLADPTAEDFAWSPDGRRVVFRVSPGGWSSWSLETGTSEPRH